MDARYAARTVSAVILLILLPLTTVAHAEETEIFMTGARFAKKGTYGPEWEPTKTKIAYAWHDKPFAVHIPFRAEVHNWGRDWDGVGDAYYTGKDYTIECYVRGMEFRALLGTDPYRDGSKHGKCPGFAGFSVVPVGGNLTDKFRHVPDTQP